MEMDMDLDMDLDLEMEMDLEMDMDMDLEMEMDLDLEMDMDMEMDRHFPRRKTDASTIPPPWPEDRDRSGHPDHGARIQAGRSSNRHRSARTHLRQSA